MIRSDENTKVWPVLQDIEGGFVDLLGAVELAGDAFSVEHLLNRSRSAVGTSSGPSYVGFMVSDCGVQRLR
jgi:hypothetical protein